MLGLLRILARVRRCVWGDRGHWVGTMVVTRGPEPHPSYTPPPKPAVSRARRAFTETNARRTCELFGHTPHAGVCVVCWHAVEVDVPDDLARLA